MVEETAVLLPENKPRYLMGVEELCVGFYEQPDLVSTS